MYHYLSHDTLFDHIVLIFKFLELVATTKTNFSPVSEFSAVSQDNSMVNFDAGDNPSCMERSPTTCLMDPTNSILAPNGHMTSPNGHMASPNGHMTSPNGHMTSPNGHMTSPNGHMASPNGHIASPNGHMASPSDHQQTDGHINGQLSPTEGHYALPNGQMMSPTGHVTSPAGHVTSPVSHMGTPPLSHLKEGSDNLTASEQNNQVYRNLLNDPQSMPHNRAVDQMSHHGDQMSHHGDQMSHHGDQMSHHGDHMSQGHNSIASSGHNSIASSGHSMILSPVQYHLSPPSDSSAMLSPPGAVKGDNLGAITSPGGVSVTRHEMDNLDLNQLSPHQDAPRVSHFSYFLT